MTPQERKLWYDFLHDYPVRFQRQKALDNYIADFYCAKAHLVIELDGSGHGTSQGRAKDSARIATLQQMGLTVLRIANADIDRHFAEVCIFLDHTIHRLLGING